MRLKRQLFRPGRRIDQIGHAAAHPFFSRDPPGTQSALRKPLLARIAENAGALFSIVVSLTLVVVVLALVVAFVKEVRQDAVYLDPIDVPRELAERGYTPAVVTDRLLDGIRAIQGGANTTKPRLGIDAATAQVDIQAPGGQLSMKSVVRYVHHLLDLPETHLTGEITRDGNELQILLRSREKRDVRLGTIRSANEVGPLLKLGAEEAVKLVDPYVLAAYLWAAEAVESGRPRTLATIRYILATPPTDDDAWALNLWGNMLRDEKRYAEAEDKFRRAYALDPRQSPALSNLVDLLAELHRRDEVLQMLASSSAQQMPPAQANRIAFNYANFGYLDKALPVFQSVLARQPGDREALFGIATCQWRMQHYAEALATMDGYAKRFPVASGGGRGFGMYATLLVDAGRVSEAERLSVELSDSAPASLPALGAKAVTLLATRRFPEARDVAASGDEKFPDTPFILEILGRARLATGDPAGAIKAFAAVLEFDPAMPDALVGYAQALAATGRNDEALAKLALSIRDRPDFAPAYAVRGRLLRQAGKVPEGNADIETARKIAARQGLLPASPLVQLIEASAKP